MLPNKTKQTQQGFTLLEMILAIAIFAMLGLAANATLQTVMQNNQATQNFATRLKHFQQGFGMISRDLGQMVARPQSGSDNANSGSFFITGSNVLDSQSQGLVFYRVGWLNPAGVMPRGTIQAVAYVHVEDRLERWHYPYPDPREGDEPKKVVLMDKVLEVKYAFYLSGSWQEQVDGRTMPQAIAIEIEQENFGKITRKFLLPETSAPAAPSSTDQGNSEQNNEQNNDQQTNQGASS